MATSSRARRRAPRQERAAATVDALLQASAELLVKRGYERMTTNHIAQRAGVSIGSLYQYFASKDALLAELIERHFTTVQDYLASAVAKLAATQLEREVDIAEHVSRLIRTLIAIEQVDAELHHAIVSKLPRVGDFAIVDTFAERFEAQVAGVLDALPQHLRPISPTLSAQLTVRAVSGVVQSTLRRDPSQLKDPTFESELVALVQRYLQL